MDDRDEFSVVVFYRNGYHSYVERYVSAKAAMTIFSRSIKAAMTMPGQVDKVIITDGGDCTNAMWIAGEGFTYPPELVGREPKLEVE
jgi:hypothetical protein